VNYYEPLITQHMEASGWLRKG